MGRLSPVSHRILIQRLRLLGFEGPYAGGKHPLMVRGNVRLTIPNYHDVEIGVDLLSRILKQAGVTREEWESTE